MTLVTRFLLHHVRGSSLSFGTTLGYRASILRLTICAGLGSWICTARLPVAIFPTYVHARLKGQRSCFTIHGKDKRGLDLLLLGKPILKRYAVDPACRQSMRSELAVLCITDSVVFPDIDGLANELKERFS